MKAYLTHPENGKVELDLSMNRSILLVLGKGNEIEIELFSRRDGFVTIRCDHQIEIQPRVTNVIEVRCVA